MRKGNPGRRRIQKRGQLSELRVTIRGIAPREMRERHRRGDPRAILGREATCSEPRQIASVRPKWRHHRKRFPPSSAHDRNLMYTVGSRKRRGTSARIDSSRFWHVGGTSRDHFPIT